jgi:membrane protein DedA with SNARE-associated domain
VARGAAGRRWSLDAAWLRRGEDVVRRFGAPAVTLCFLTVGVQTAVNLAAGTLRMPLRRYLPALLLGALLWAGVYLTVGIAVVEAFWGSGRPWLLLAVLAAAGLTAVAVRHLLRRRVTG